MLISEAKNTYRRVIAKGKSSVRRVRSSRLESRWKKQAAGIEAKNSPLEKDADVFEGLKVVVINLDSRPDRLEDFKGEMTKLGIRSWNRLSAVDGRQEFPNLDPFYSGSIGCSLSHVLAFEQTNWKDTRALLVCEDDVEFLVGRSVLSSYIEEFLDNPVLDVLALYGRARGGSFQISEKLRIVVGLVGTVCYVVKPHMAEVIGDLFAAGVSDLKRGKRKGKSDVLWNKLQKKDYFFASPIETCSRNREGFSDIEGKHLGPR